MIKALLCAFAALSFCNANATNISGVMSTSTTWTKANSPYIVTGNFMVDTGATLTIEPGVTISIAPNMLFYINGGLNASGTVTDMITFTSTVSPTTRWPGISCQNKGMNDPIIFKYCKVEGGQFGIQVSARQATISNCTFNNCWEATKLIDATFDVNNNTISVGAGAIYIFRSTGAASHNDIEKMVGTAITVTDNSSVVINNNNVHDNRGGINVNGSKAGRPVEIRDNIITNIEIIGLSAGNIVAANISGNIITGSGYAACGLDDLHGSMTDNAMKHNKHGIYLGIKWNSDFNFTNNCIDSTIDNVAIHNGSQDVVLPGNYWGYADSTDIHNHTDDYYTNFTSGKIYYGTFLTQEPASCKTTPTPPTNIVNQAPPSTVSVYPNPFSSEITINTGGNNDAEYISVYNMTGCKLVSQQFSNKTSITVNLAAYPAGMYFYTIHYKNNTIYKGKISKQ